MRKVEVIGAKNAFNITESIPPNCWVVWPPSNEVD
jgi:hypothetical protein